MLDSVVRFQKEDNGVLWYADYARRRSDPTTLSQSFLMLGRRWGLACLTTTLGVL